MEESIRILVLEDDMNDLELMEYELRKAGLVYSSKVVQLERDFEQAIHDFKPDIILSDYSLPYFDGPQAFKIRQRLCQQVPFIFVSGAIGEENSVELIRNGVTDYVLKDKLFTLAMRIRRALAEAREKEEKAIAQRHLEQNERLLAEAQAVAKLGNWEIDLSTGKQTWSDEMYHLLGIEKEKEASAELFRSFIEKEDLAGITGVAEQARQALMPASFTFRYRPKDGGLHYARSEWKFELDEEGSPVRQYGIVQDITERVQAEQEILKKNQELRELSGHLRDIREEERKHIAREIHDELGQHLTALKMDVGGVMHKLDTDIASARERLNQMLSLCDEIINTVRRISSELRPAIIDDLGLIAALEWKCTDFEDKTGVTCHFVSGIPERRFDSGLGINIYRILQETLTNVSRHAQATEVDVSITENEDGLVMEIRDNGKGIPEDRMRNGKTLGIVGMKERARLLGGNLEISSPGKGTITKLTLPLKHEHINS